MAAPSLVASPLLSLRRAHNKSQEQRDPNHHRYHCGTITRSQACDGFSALADGAVDLVIELRGLRLPGPQPTALGAGLVLNGHRSLRFQDPPMLCKHPCLAQKSLLLNFFSA